MNGLDSEIVSPWCDFPVRNNMQRRRKMRMFIFVLGGGIVLQNKSCGVQDEDTGCAGLSVRSGSSLPWVWM